MAFPGPARRRRVRLRLAALLAMWITALSASGQNTTPTTATIAGPVELIEAGNAAYTAGDWAKAATEFETFLTHYGSAPEAAETVAQVKPLLALARIRLKDFGPAGQLITECLALPKLDPKLRDELAFWKGIVLLQLQAYEQARDAFLAYYQTPQFQAPRRVESILLYGTTYLLESDHAQTATFFEQQAARLWQSSHEAALRAQTLRLHSLLELGRLDEARELIASIQPHMEEVTQIVSLHGLTAELGGRFLEQGNEYAAIFCLQRVWPANRLLRHQADRIERLQREVDSLQAQPGQEGLQFAKKSVLTRIEREQRSFSQATDFDLGVRMRLGFAYLGLERWREAALVLEEALNLPGDPAQQAQAGLAVIQCWHELKRYDRCVASADSWLIRFADKVEEDAVVRTRYLLGQAHYDDQAYADAAPVFVELNDRHPKHELAGEALLMAGLAWMMADENEIALELLEEVGRRYASLPLAEDASYWKGMAFSFDQQHLACREHLATHLDQFQRSGRFTAAAEFRRAYSRFMLADYEGAIAELADYGERHPEGPDVGEAWVLKGDAEGSLGEIDSAVESYRSVPVDSEHWFHEAQFKIGKIHQLRRDHPLLLSHFESYIEAYPESSRLAEAVYWAGKAWTEQDQPGKARELYWNAIAAHGDDARHRGVEDILLTLPTLYSGPDARLELLREIQRRRAEAEQADREELICRLHWMEGQMQEKPRLAQADFMMAAQTIDVRRHSPRILIDCAEASRAAGSKSRAAELYRDLIKWHPRSVERERAHAGLGFLAIEGGDSEQALEHFRQFEKRSVTPELASEVALTKAHLLASQDRIDEAISVYKTLLGNKLTAGRTKAEALLQWGDLLKRQERLLPATAYYERVYLGYAKHRDLAARAYLARGRTLESLGRSGDAAEVYTELRASEQFAEFPEFEEAAQRLKVTGPPPAPLPEPAPEEEAE